MKELSVATTVAAAAAAAAWQLAHRTSPLVRRWRPTSFTRRDAGPLSVYDSGSTGRAAEQVVVVLHGLGATGDYFGAFYDDLSRQRRVVIVDVLGFGRSLDEQRSDFTVDAHVESLDQALAALGLGDTEVVLAAHSMSTAIALTWADRNRQRTQHVYLWGPPVYPLGTAAASVGKEFGLMGRLFALDTKWAERACRVNCMNRNASGRAMALFAPRWPTEVSSGASRHTWDAYHLSLRNLILEFDWTKVLPASVPVTIFHGSADRIGDRAHIAMLTNAAEYVDVAGADHHVALQRPELLAEALERDAGADPGVRSSRQVD